MTVNAPSIKDIKAGFVHQTCNKIQGEPNYNAIDLLQRQCTCNTPTLESMLREGNNGLAGLSEFPVVYLACTGYNFVCPPNPGDFSTYSPQAAPPQHEHKKQQFELNKKNYD
eukprot:6952992-Ditylum_brightwellii.AAC.1